ncbi:MAG: AbrB/MazE/SpoVT family DNA-binding domain-containing protein [Hominimerdicola sp.]
MKSTGIVRKIDELGRIVLPIELRRTYELAVKDAVEIYTDDDKIILKKFQRTCIFCGSCEDVVEYKGKTVCSECMAELKGENK